jgi:hypothetical protein
MQFACKLTPLELTPLTLIAKGPPPHAELVPVAVKVPSLLAVKLPEVSPVEGLLLTKLQLASIDTARFSAVEPI